MSECVYQGVVELLRIPAILGGAFLVPFGVAWVVVTLTT